MSRPRKTIMVSSIKSKVNSQLCCKDLTPEARMQLALLLESILCDTDNYEGFNYVGWALEGGCEKWHADGKPSDNKPYLGDETRRVYY